MKRIIEDFRQQHDNLVVHNVGLLTLRVFDLTAKDIETDMQSYDTYIPYGYRGWGSRFCEILLQDNGRSCSIDRIRIYKYEDNGKTLIVDTGLDYYAK